MLTVRVETNFWASHRLSLPDGAKEPLHSHNFSVTADVSGDKLSNMGFVMDFRRLRAMLDNIVAEFDNIELENIDYFRNNSSSTENVAKYIYERLQPVLPKGVKLEAITVAEQLGCSAKFAGPS